MEGRRSLGTFPSGATFFMHDGKVEVAHLVWGGSTATKTSGTDIDVADLQRTAEKMFAEARNKHQR
jgi:hypothetical protein